ncbi:MAG: hypothetical protein M3Z41_05315 [Candidatus Eremiobacteraeota bacterium]|nr:hypothetical protein [Candidatus Eremiobacteraeota bacterium]
MRRFAIVLALLVAGCGSAVPQRVLMNDDRVQPLLKAAATFDRTRYGFTPIPQEATALLESVPNDGYDAMLHINSKTARTIAFRKTSTGYAWIGEQEVFRGPKRYTTPNGTFNEAISLTYEIANVAGVPPNQLNIAYYGQDPRLARVRTLTLKIIKPIVREWGY